MNALNRQDSFIQSHPSKDVTAAECKKRHRRHRKHRKRHVPALPSTAIPVRSSSFFPPGESTESYTGLQSTAVAYPMAGTSTNENHKQTIIAPAASLLSSVMCLPNSVFCSRASNGFRLPSSSSAHVKDHMPGLESLAPRSSTLSFEIGDVSSERPEEELEVMPLSNHNQKIEPAEQVQPLRICRPEPRRMASCSPSRSCRWLQAGETSTSSGGVGKSRSTPPGYSSFAAFEERLFGQTPSSPLLCRPQVSPPVRPLGPNVGNRKPREDGRNTTQHRPTSLEPVKRNSFTKGNAPMLSSLPVRPPRPIRSPLRASARLPNVTAGPPIPSQQPPTWSNTAQQTENSTSEGVRNVPTYYDESHEYLSSEDHGLIALTLAAESGLTKNFEARVSSKTSSRSPSMGTQSSCYSGNDTTETSGNSNLYPEKLPVSNGGESPCSPSNRPRCSESRSSVPSLSTSPTSSPDLGFRALDSDNEGSKCSEAGLSNFKFANVWSAWEASDPFAQKPTTSLGLLQSLNRDVVRCPSPKSNFDSELPRLSSALLSPFNSSSSSSTFDVHSGFLHQPRRSSLSAQAPCSESPPGLVGTDVTTLSTGAAGERPFCDVGTAF
ncbi:unnamed protein product [Sympodiomycopsis kandeliae]